MWAEGDVLAAKYRLTRRIGQGSTAEAFKAENLLVGRIVAVKVLRPSFAQDADVRARFLAEARAAARIAHPNVVDVFDLGTAEDGTPFIVMELCDGETLSTIIDERGRVGVEYACDLMVQVLAALHAAHAIGIVHRDLKPDNIMVVHRRPDEPVVKVLDFGIAQGVLAESAAQSEGGLIFGTAEYMAPEQARGETVDARADLYAAGAILFELLTGQQPVNGETLDDVVDALLHVDPPAVTTLAPDVPDGLSRLIAIALEKDRAHRPPSAIDFLLELSAFGSADRLRTVEAYRGETSDPLPLVQGRRSAVKPRLVLVPESHPPPARKSR